MTEGARPRGLTVAAEVRALAKEHSVEAVNRLVELMRTGKDAVAVQAAKNIIGLAGIPLAPAPTVKHVHDTPPALPVSVGLRELLSLVRGGQLPGAMAPNAKIAHILPPQTGGAPPDRGSHDHGTAAEDADFIEVSRAVSRTTEQPSGVSPNVLGEEGGA